MANLVDAMRAFGIRNPQATAEAIRLTGIDPASAMAVLTMETSGGAPAGAPMVWGHDHVDPEGTYTPGGPVTEGNVRAYLAGPAQHGHRQGCGDAQLTSKGYQDSGAARGGMWLPVANQAAGFDGAPGVATGLATLQRQYGLRDGFRRYNGSGPQADAYADKAMLLRNRAAIALAGVTAGGPAPAGGILRRGSTGPAVARLQQTLHDRFHLYCGDVVADGDFGPKTEACLTEYQRRSNLVPDGVAGPATLGSLGLA